MKSIILTAALLLSGCGKAPVDSGALELQQCVAERFEATFNLGHNGFCEGAARQIAREKIDGILVYAWDKAAAPEALITTGTATTTPLLVLATSSTEPIPACHHCPLPPPKIEKHRRHKKRPDIVTMEGGTAHQHPAVTSLGDPRWFVNGEGKVTRFGSCIGGSDRKTKCDYAVDKLYTPDGCNWCNGPNSGCTVMACTVPLRKLGWYSFTDDGDAIPLPPTASDDVKVCDGSGCRPPDDADRMRYGSMIPELSKPAKPMTPQQFTDFMNDALPVQTPNTNEITKPSWYPEDNSNDLMPIGDGPLACTNPYTDITKTCGPIHYIKAPSYPPDYKMPIGDGR